MESLDLVVFYFGSQVMQSFILQKNFGLSLQSKNSKRLWMNLILEIDVLVNNWSGAKKWDTKLREFIKLNFLNQEGAHVLKDCK